MKDHCWQAFPPGIGFYWLGQTSQQMKKTIIAGLLMLGSLLAPAATVVDLEMNLTGDGAPARAIDVNTSANQTYHWSCREKPGTRGKGVSP